MREHLKPLAAAFQLTFFPICCLFANCNSGVEPADLLLLNGKIVTIDNSAPQTEALAVRDDRIVWTGSSEAAAPYAGPATQVLDLEGRLAIPGFIEGHAHFSGIGEARLKLNLTKAPNWNRIIEMVREAIETREPGEWVLGRGWHQEKWDGIPKPSIGGLPQHDQMSRVSPENPVLLTHASGHAVFANAKAMELAGISSRTPDPAGGEIVRDLQGHPIGVFRETAENLFNEALRSGKTSRTEQEQKARLKRIVQLASHECLSKGITSFHDAGVSLEFAEFLRELAQTGELPLRLYLMLNESNEILAPKLSEYRWINLENGRLTVRAIKRFIDGALGAHGAWLLDPYEDLPVSNGLNTVPLESIGETAHLAIENGFQLCVHAIGDRANQQILNLFEKSFKSYPDKRDLRWRIEHAQHLAVSDIPRFSQLGVIAAMQPIHATSDGPWVFRRLGMSRAEEGAYVWRKLLDAGTVIASGTDAPVEDVDPIRNFYAAVTRKMTDGTAFFPDQRMSREQALRSFTLDCAYAAFEETDKGSLTLGKLADITILSNDIMSVPVDEILKTRVEYTIVGGEIAYAAP